MGITRFTLVLAVMALLFALPGMVLADEPPVPSVFGGTATLDGAPAPDGTTVSALIDGTVVAATTVENGAYAFTIPQPPDESYSGKTVTFLIGGATAAETGIWEAEGGGVLNLSASGGQIPQVTAEQTPQDPVVILLDGGTAANGPKRKAFVGVVEGDPFLNDVLAESVTISQKGNKGEITISLANPDIKIKKPGGPRVRGTFSDGARVVIQARNEDDGWVAIRVLVKPVKPAHPAFTGAVVAIAEGVITIMQPDGSTKQVELEAGATPPAIGELVTGFTGPAGDDGEGGANKPAKAKGLVKASKIRARLEGFLQELTTDTGDLPEAAAEAKAKAKVKAAQGKAEAARTKVDTARTKAKAARTKAETAQGANAAEVEELAADAEEEAAEAVADQAEAEAELAEAEAEAAAEAAEAEAEAADRRAQQVADVAAILNSHTNKHLKLLENLSKEDLPAQAKAGMEKALANAQRGRSVATLKAAEARAKTEDKTLKALAKAEEKRVEALARTEEKRVKALARVEEKKDRALARAEEKKDRALVRAEEKRVQALAKPEGERGNALAKAEEEKGRALAKAEEEKENALAKAEEELQKAQAEQDREAAQARAERDREAAQGPGNSQGKGRSR
ncbi:MAG: hypothetical protein IIC96_07195 [Chloroflexi bacterium]|nr:hypothetical protein [Chloroflexota bacterium]